VARRELAQKWRVIPYYVHSLFTHRPPFCSLDDTSRAWSACEALQQRIENPTDLRLHTFRHVHESARKAMIGGVLYVNAAFDALREL
jgi:Icc-related predicted phosphoesterase